MTQGCSTCGSGDGGGNCGCGCAGHDLSAPANRAGLNAIGTRLGDYRDFFGAAIGRLSDQALPALRDLGTRAMSDPAIAWLDAWALAADVLTFYRERLTNESYLRTAQDERALRELAALVGFKPRPGVSATAYLAYLMEPTAAPVAIEAPAKAQTQPGPGERMQTFETGETFVAHAEWGRMAPRLTRPARITIVDALVWPALRLSTTSLNVSPGQRVLFVFGPKLGHQVVREVASAKVDIINGHVELELKPRFPPGVDANKAATRLIELREKVAKRVTSASGTTAIKGPVATTPTERVIPSILLGGSAVDARRILGEEVRIGAANANATGGGPSVVSTMAQDVSDGLDVILSAVEREPKEISASTVDSVLSAVGRPRPAQLSSSRRLTRSAGGDLSTHGQDRLALLQAMSPELSDALAAALDTLPIAAAPKEVAPRVFLMQRTAGAFAAFAPQVFHRRNPPTEHPLAEADTSFAYLDALYDGIRPGSYVILDRPHSVVPGRRAGGNAGLIEANVGLSEVSAERTLEIGMVRAAQPVARRAYDLSSKSTRLELVRLDKPLETLPLTPDLKDETPDISFLRSTIYHVQSEEVTVADDVDEEDVWGSDVELQVRVDGLQSGQWVIVAGERTDIKDANGHSVPGVQGGERAMIAAVTQDPHPLTPLDTLHTVISFVTPLAYRYKRSSVIVYGNVVDASHGETGSEVLGSGDASRPGQQFVTKRPPLTFTAAATPEGVEGSEVVRVNGVRYERVDSLLDASPATRAYQLDVDAGGFATMTFGDGVHGAVLPSGSQNVRAEYRAGIGSAGNARAWQIKVLTTRPLGVTDVINPLRASGGADRDGPERIRRNAPLAALGLSPLSRLVSVADYATFARRFAGIGHADAVRLSDGTQHVVHLTVAGVDDNPLDADGQLLTNLRAAYAAYGDPTYPVEIGVRALKALVLEARVAVEPSASWDLVEPEVRRRLNDTFSFERRGLGQSAYLSEAVAVIQATPGVAWVDVDTFAGLPETLVQDAKRLKEAMDDLAVAPVAPVVSAARAVRDPQWKPKWKQGSGQPRFTSAELVFLLPAVRGLLVLNPV